MRSAPGKGTRLRFYFPQSTEQITSEWARVGAEETIDLRGTETILVVDDEESLRGLCQNILERQGYNVLCVDSGEAALSLLERCDVDLVLSDVVMAGVNWQR